MCTRVPALPCCTAIRAGGASRRPVAAAPAAARVCAAPRPACALNARATVARRLTHTRAFQVRKKCCTDNTVSARLTPRALRCECLRWMEE